MTQATIRVAPQTDARRVIAKQIARARAAQREFEQRWTTQAQVDGVVTAIGWVAYQRENAEQLARVAVEDTGMGRVDDKIEKTRRKNFGTLRDLRDPGARSMGVIEELPDRGLVKIAKPMGVVAALVPSTNPEATPFNKVMMALKGRNAIVLAPSPKGARTCALAVEFMHRELRKVGAPLDLVQHLPGPISKELTTELMRQADFVVVTGSQSNVRAAYSSGTPAIGVGAGNVPVIVDRSADLDDAAEKIKRSKVFDYATSCSSENHVLIHADVYEPMLDTLRRQGGVLLTPSEKQQLQRAMWPDGRLSDVVVAKPPRVLAERAGFEDPATREAEFFMVEEEGVGREYPFSGEKLSVVLTVYRFRTFDEGLELAQRILDYQGAGHSIGLHSRDEEHVWQAAHTMRVVRVLVNQAHTFGNGGGFDNGLNFTLTMGAGTWARNSISENLSYRHFLNFTHLVRAIPPRIPSEEELFGEYLRAYGA